ncbi:hypothetical protein J4234_00345 [Candidatus Woesearchaeota archaeon]|nr:hypothetical protein [Candidatus Woesearchaeota archaeon]
MLKRFCQTAKLRKKGSGLTDFFSILTFVLVIIVFYGIFKFTIGGSKFEIGQQSKSIEDSLSLLSILRTNVNVGNIEMNIAELIALSYSDPSKKSNLENHLIKVMNDSFGASDCAIFCIGQNQIKTTGCSLNTGYHTCSSDIIQIPAYDGKIIEVSLNSKIEPLNLQSAP